MLRSLILATDKNGLIGKDNALPWNLPEDLKIFKSLTLNNTVLMGRKTWQSLPVRPLKDRCNIVISRDYSDFPESLTHPERECYLFSAIEHGLDFAEKLGCQECFIIGGKQIYEYILETRLYDKVYHSVVLGEYTGDTSIDISAFDDLLLANEVDKGDFVFRELVM